MTPYPVLCSCAAAATHKVAARWSDGFTHELKTYALCCEACLPAAVADAEAKRAACRLAHGEELGEVAVYGR